MSWRLQTQPRPLYTLPLLLAPPVMYTCAFQGHLGAGSQLEQTRTPSRLRETWIVTGVALFWICPGVPQTINFKIVTYVIADGGSPGMFKIVPSPPRLPSADLQFNMWMHDVNWCILRCFSWLEASFAHTAGLAWLTLNSPYFPSFACSSCLACYFLSTTHARVHLTCCFCDDFIPIYSTRVRRNWTFSMYVYTLFMPIFELLTALVLIVLFAGYLLLNKRKGDALRPLPFKTVLVSMLSFAG
jgi:hypothetical protein